MSIKRSFVRGSVAILLAGVSTIGIVGTAEAKPRIGVSTGDCDAARVYYGVAADEEDRSWTQYMWTYQYLGAAAAEPVYQRVLIAQEEVLDAGRARDSAC